MAPQRQGQDDVPLNAYAARQVNGEAMTKLSIKRETLEQASRIAGVVPFSVWNFNPVPAAIWKLGTKYSIPPALSPLGIKKTVHWDDAERIASSMVFREIKGFPATVSVANEPGGDANNPVMQYDWRVVQPIELVRAFEYEYNGRSEGMGGMLVFQGDPHSVGSSSDQIIQVPVVRRAKGGALLYTTESVSLAEKLDQVLGKQKEYCFRKLQTAQDWSDDPDKRSSVHDGPMGFEAWGQFAINLGWQDQEEIRWMVKQKTSGACVRCGKMRSSGKAMFCSCGHPYDAFRAYMDGMKVDLDVLAALPAEQLEQVKSEMRRRERLFKDLEPEPEKHGKGKSA